MLLCLTLASLDAVLLGHRRPQPDRKIALGDAEVLAFHVRQRLDAAALAGDDGVGRLVEQHEHRLDRRHALLVLVAKAHQRVDVDQREIAGAGRDARNGVRRSAGDIDRDRESLGAEQAVGRRHHERRVGRIDRPVERELDRERRPRFVRGKARPRSEAHHSAKACKQGKHWEQGVGSACTHGAYVTGDGTSCRAGKFVGRKSVRQVCFMTRTPALQALSRRHSVASNLNGR